MALKLADRVKETTTTEGTGDIALGGAVNGFLAFSSRLSTGDTTFYAIVLGTQWEVGIGTLTAATTLKRTTVLSSSNSDALVPFAAGTKEVFIDLPGALADRIADFIIPEATVASAATVDLGAQNSRKIAISGTTAITSFGTKAHAEKLLRFTGACTLTYDATALILPTGANIVTAAGDTALVTSDANGNWRVRHYQRADGSPLIPVPLGQCRLVFVSTSQIALKPYQGNLIWVNGAYRTIPAAGWTLSNASLVSGAVYHVYAPPTGNVLEASTTGHVTHTDGSEIKSGDPSRAYVGMVATDAGTPGTFADSLTRRYVASWFNRQARDMRAAQASYSTGSQTYTELATAQRLQFVSFGDETIDFYAAGYMYNNNAANSLFLALGLDGTPLDPSMAADETTANFAIPINAPAKRLVTEGFHTVSPFGRASVNTTGTFVISNVGVIRS